ncbi:MAG: hypothetical protein JWP75_2879 [Frondihabitans sp.]|nr:hypothetical protein [Frondihabitans sp.]
MRHYVESDPHAPEIPLLGGDVTEGLVVKNNTVRRPPLLGSDAVARLLTELERVGFDGSPRHLGVDDQGRHVLTFVEGEVAARPWPAWVASEERLVSLARLVRRYDDAAAALGIPSWATELEPAEVEGAPPRIARDPELVAHLDITPENVVFRNAQAHALIDFDLAKPATRVDEVCNLLLWWAPWMPVRDRREVLRDADPAHRARLVVDAYGLEEQDRRLLVSTAQNVADRSWFSMRHRARTLGGGWQRMWDEGVGDVILRRQVWLRENAAALEAAVA